ncbi:phosphopantetheine-binding protein [Nocardia suismassiliense]|uniref:Phosphopantetheine-binding protein n=1 Tax=Nocardia suismassiliense TaxID=2077092 RepID=A0ABW6R0S9_9NOCA
MNEEFVSIIRARLPFLTDEEPLLPDANLTDLGLDSLRTVSLLLDLEDALAISLPDSVVGDPETFSTPQRLWQAVDEVRANS